MGVRVLVVDVRVVLVLVSHRCMAMPVRVLAFGRDALFVSVLVVFVMDVLMGVLHGFMCVDMTVPFGQVKPDPYGHERSCKQ